MRLADPSTSVANVSAGLSRCPGSGGAGSAAGSGGSSGSAASVRVTLAAAAPPRRAGAAGARTTVGPSRGANTSSTATGCPVIACSAAPILPTYWARTQSILKRLATASVTRAPSSDTRATKGRIQVLTCCTGSSWLSRSTHADHKSGAAQAAARGAAAFASVRERGELMGARQSPHCSHPRPVIHTPAPGLVPACARPSPPRSPIHLATIGNPAGFCHNLGFCRASWLGGLLFFWARHHETHLSTLQNPSRTYPWLSGSHEDPWRPCRHQRAPRQGSQAPGRLTRSARRCPHHPCR
jgi:hypothetical protein